MSRYGIHELFESFDLEAACEEFDLPHGDFVARFGKLYRKSMVIFATVAICLGLFILWLDIEQLDISLIFLTLGGLLLLLATTFLTYRCTVNKVSLKEEYWILCFKCKKEVLWNDIKYKKLKYGRTNSIYS